MAKITFAVAELIYSCIIDDSFISNIWYVALYY